MIAGMIVLGPLESLLLNPIGWAELRAQPEVNALVMATNMTIPMAVWMRFPTSRLGPNRGDGRRHVYAVRGIVPIDVAGCALVDRAHRHRPCIDAVCHGRRDAMAPRGVRRR
jgi:hypothetical protein